MWRRERLAAVADVDPDRRERNPDAPPTLAPDCCRHRVAVRDGRFIRERLCSANCGFEIEATSVRPFGLRPDQRGSHPVGPRRRFGGSTASTLAASPNLTNAQLAAWLNGGVIQRYPGLSALSYIVRVPAAGLSAFAAAEQRDPTPLAVPGPFVVVPPGARPSYCFVRLNVAGATAGSVKVSPGLDICALDIPAVRTETVIEDSGMLGVTTISPSQISDITSVLKPDQAAAAAARARLTGFDVAMALPIYAGSPTTVAQRRAQLIGWLAATFDGPAVVRSLMVSHEQLALTLRWTEHGQDQLIAEQPAAFHGAALRNVTTFDVDGHWTIELAGSAAPAQAAAASEARAVTLTGMVLSLLVAIILWGGDRGSVDLLAQRQVTAGEFETAPRR